MNNNNINFGPNPNEPNPNGPHQNEVDGIQAPADLFAQFERLDEIKKAIVWLYFLYFHTAGVLGADPECAGSIHHYKISAWFTDRITSGQFKYRAKQMASLAVAMKNGTSNMLYIFTILQHDQLILSTDQLVDIHPPGPIPIFLIPLDGGRRPNVVTIDTLVWVRHPNNPAAHELWHD